MSPNGQAIKNNYIWYIAIPDHAVLICLVSQWYMSKYTKDRLLKTSYGIIAIPEF